MADASGVPPLILIELAAQTAGVCNGWDRIQTKGIDSERMGWLVGIKKADFSIDHLPFGCDIISRARNTFRFDKLREVACEQHINDRLISRITLQLFQANTDE
jgi:predicted hotdog family 3-hydroxylacyl-ACP dehydratase